MLQAEGLAFRFRRGRQILSDVGFAMGPGESVCILGPNGAGKTTLLRCLLGLNHPTAGRVGWDGRDLLAMSRRERARRMAYVPQSSLLNFPYEVHDVVLMGRVAHLGLGSAPGAADHRIASEALDFANQVRTLTLIRELARDGYAVLMTSHSPDHAFLASHRALLIRDGGIFRQGATDEVITPTTLSGLYETTTAVVNTGIRTAQGEVRVCVPILDPQETNQKGPS